MELTHAQYSILVQLNFKYRFVISVMAKREVGEIEKLTLAISNNE